MRRVLLFVNPVFEQRSTHRGAMARILSLLRASELTVEVQETLSAQSAGDQARQAIADGFDTILVCGGDGTVFNIVQGVAGTEVPIGIIPFGTGNVLAQNMRLPRDPLEAVRALFHATPKRIPLGRITIPRPAHIPGHPPDLLKDKSWYFTMAAGMGLHAVLLGASDAWGKRAIGRASYYFAGMSLLMRHRIQPFEIEVTTTDGNLSKRLVCEALAVRVPELNRWRPGGRLEEPVLRLAAVDATDRWGLARASFQALARTSSPNGWHDPSEQPQVRYTDAVRVVCRPCVGYDYQPGVLAEADGEVLGASTAVIDVARESFYLLWPEHAGPL